MTAHILGPSGWERVGAVSDVAMEPPNPASEYDRIGETVTDALSSFARRLPAQDPTEEAAMSPTMPIPAYTKSHRATKLPTPRESPSEGNLMAEKRDPTRITCGAWRVP